MLNHPGREAVVLLVVFDEMLVHIADAYPFRPAHVLVQAGQAQATLAVEHLADALEDGVFVLLDEKCENGAELFAGIGPRGAGLRFACDQDGGRLRDTGQPGEHGDLMRGLADDLRVDRAVRAQQELCDLGRFLGI